MLHTFLQQAQKRWLFSILPPFMKSKFDRKKTNIFAPILAAPLINTACSIDAVQFVYDINNRWLRIVGGGEGEHCELEAPTVSLVTGCSESEFIAFWSSSAWSIDSVCGRWHSSQTPRNGTTFALLQTPTNAFASTKFGQWSNRINYKLNWQKNNFYKIVYCR